MLALPLDGGTLRVQAVACLDLIVCANSHVPDDRITSRHRQSSFVRLPPRNFRVIRGQKREDDSLLIALDVHAAAQRAGAEVL